MTPASLSAARTSGVIFFLAGARTLRPLASVTSSAAVRPTRPSPTSQKSFPSSTTTLEILWKSLRISSSRAEAEGPEEDGGQELLLAVEADPEEVLGVVLELDPGAAVRDDLGDEEALGLGLAEEHARRALELADDDPLDAVEDERALLGHERDVAEIDFLLLDVLEPLGLGRGVLLPGHELDLELEGDGVGVALLDALHRGVLDPEADAVAAVLAERAARSSGPRRRTGRPPSRRAPCPRGGASGRRCTWPGSSRPP